MALILELIVAGVRCATPFTPALVFNSRVLIIVPHRAVT
jgi:hypothetical protein